MTTSTSITYTTDAEQLAALRIPFPITDVKQREQSGKQLSFYEHNVIQNRLLDVFGTGLSLTTNATCTDKENSSVHVEVLLEVEWVSGRKSKVSGWGTASIQKSGDHFKAAFSDGLKVSATKLGCGLELYDANYREGLEARIKMHEEYEYERAFLTCQGCGGEIKAGFKKKSDGVGIELTAKQVADISRQKLGKRMCIACADQAAADKSSAGKTKPDAVEIDC